MQRDFSKLKDRKFDLLVCGGGIYGAWTAYDAALRGLQVAIIEQADWASGTSSASTKLIHGGLRYLETYDFKLVKKALTEREMLLQMAPHRVWPLRFGVPVYKSSRIGRLRLKLGLSLYDFFAGNKPSQQHRYFNQQQFVQQFPDIEDENLLAGFTYLDAQTDDSRLVLELIDGAISAGAVCLNYCKVTEYLDTYGQTTGAEVIDLVDHDTLKVNAKQIVNTTGRWQSEYPEANTWCRLSKGIHLVLPKVLNDHALLLTAKSDGRVFFIIPWYGLSLLGTTDTHYSGDINQLNIEQQEIDYLLNEANHYLPHVNWQEKDILGQFAGLRVLRQSDDTSPSSVSRDWELKTLPNGLHISIGGKITSAREDASKIVDIVTSNLGLMEDCKTRNKAFPWKPAIPYSDWLTMTIQQGLQLGIDFESLHWLIRRHGNRVTKVFALVEHEPSLNKRLLPCLPFILADFTFCVQHEMVVHLEDILRRRIPLVILAKISLPELRQMAKLTGDIMNWTHSRIESELEHCRKQWPTTKSRD